jgi:hypothetical protein
VPDENDRAALHSDGALSNGDVVGERRGRILNDGHIISVLLQRLVDALPSGSVHEAAVNENDILYCFRFVGCAIRFPPMLNMVVMIAKTP